MARVAEINPAMIGVSCRFYEREYPEVEECVMVNVKRIAEMGAYVQVRRAGGRAWGAKRARTGGATNGAPRACNAALS